MQEDELNNSWLAGKNAKTIEDSEFFYHTLNKDDVLIIHNHAVENFIHAKDLKNMIHSTKNNGVVDKELLADKIATVIKKHMKGEHKDTPYHVKSEFRYGTKHKGEKYDDIFIMVVTFDEKI